MKSRELDRVFEAYAVAEMKLEELRKDPRQEHLLGWYRSLCLDMQAEVVELLQAERRTR